MRMPTYEYECRACNHRFEELQSFSEASLKKCPVCKKKKLHRLIGPGAAIIFKGSGFYQTDYRSDSYKKAAEADKTASEPAKPATDSKATGDGKAKADGQSAPSPKAEPATTKAAATPAKNEA